MWMIFEHWDAAGLKTDDHGVVGVYQGVAEHDVLVGDETTFRQIAENSGERVDTWKNIMRSHDLNKCSHMLDLDKTCIE